MSELQDELEPIENEVVEQEVEDEVIEQDETKQEIEESKESDSELAPDSEEEHEEKPQDAAEIARSKINKKHWQYKEEERKRLALEAELEAIKAQYAPKEPEIPQAPDPFSDNYEQEQQQYQQKLIEYGQHQYSKQLQQQQQQQTAQQKQQQQIEETQGKVESYAKKAETLGVSKEKLAEAGRFVANSGIDNDVAMIILDDDSGPLITTYLYDNPSESEKVSSMKPLQAALYIERNIKPNLQALKPKTTNAPKPVKGVSGGSADPDLGKFPLTSGAKFE